MATATISMNDVLLAQVRAAAGEDLSAWIAAACHARLLAESAHAAREWEWAHPSEAAAARAAEAARQLEFEAEREVTDHAEAAARHRGGEGTEPATADYLAAYRHVRALLEQAEQQLRERTDDR